MTITLNSGKITLLIDEPDITNSKEWKIVKQENYRPDRGEYLLGEFKKKFPKHAKAVNSFTMLTNLASRSKTINNWLIGASTGYVLEVNAPQYLKEVVEPIDYKNASVSLNVLNSNARKRADEEQLVVQEYKSKMKEIEEKYEELNSIPLKNKIVKILSLNSNYLPITLQLMIENYTPTTTSESPDKKTYARELLTCFKLSLLKYFKDEKNKDINIDEFLEQISEK